MQKLALALLLWAVGCSSSSHGVGFGPGVAEDVNEVLRETEVIHTILKRNGEAYRIEHGALLDERHSLVHAILEAEPDRTPPDNGLRDVGISFGDSVYRLPYTGRTITFHYEVGRMRLARIAPNQFTVWLFVAGADWGYRITGASDIERAWLQLERSAAAEAKPMRRFIGSPPVEPDDS